MKRARVLATALAGLALLAFLASPALAQSQTAQSKASSKSPVAEAPPAEGSAEGDLAEKVFTVMLVNGKKIKLSVFPNPRGPEKIIKFETPIPKNDPNLYACALKAMWEIYGTQKGSFKMEDASIVQRKDVPGGSFIAYKIKTGGRFCTYPTADEMTPKEMKGMVVWME